MSETDRATTAEEQAKAKPQPVEPPPPMAPASQVDGHKTGTTPKPPRKPK